MKEQLIHILDQSVCLSRKQMKEYLNGAMLPEETHAAEVHLSSCPLCSLAMEGFSEHSDQALQAIAALNSGFLKDHFDNISPQIHLNSMAPAASMQMSRSDRRRGHVQPLWRVGSIAAAMLLLFGLIWAFERSHNKEASAPGRMAMNNGYNGNAGSSGSSNNSSFGNSGNTNGSVSSANAPVNAGSQSGKTNEKSAASAADKNLNATAAVPGKKAPAPAATLSAPRNNAMSAAHPAAASVSNAESEPNGGSVAAKDPPATKTYTEYDPSANDQSEKKETPSASHSETVAARSVSGGIADSKSKSVVSQPKSTDTRDDVERGDESYSKGSYAVSLASFKKSMNSSDEHIRYHSMVMAAQCYAALGNNAKAQELLKRVIDNAPGPDRRAAKRALRKLR